MIDNLNITQLVATNIKLSQTLYTEKDKSTPCVNYPTESFKSYGECDQNFVQQKVSDTLGSIPFWIAESLGKDHNDSIFNVN